MNSLYKYFLPFSIILLFFSSCIEETWPELDDNDQSLLVIEGRINNYPGPYTIKLSTTQSLDSVPIAGSYQSDFSPYMGASISIIDDQGNSESLTETEAGIYKTSEAGMQGVIGRSYKLSIVSPDGDTYESDFEKIIEPVGIDTIYTQEAIVDGVIPGYQFYITTELNPENHGYYFWELTETYEYSAPYVPTHVYEGKYTNAYYDSDGTFHKGSYDTTAPHNLPKRTSQWEYKVCWQTADIESSYRQSTKYLAESRVRDFPLHFIHFTHIRLRIKYSLLAKQHSVSEKAYKYFSEIESQNSYDENELYTKQPYQMRGNISNINNPDEAVLGFFYASSISEKRMFAPKDPRPKTKIVYAVEYCRGIPSVHYERGNPINNMQNYHNYIDSRPFDWPVYFGHAYIYDENLMPWEYISWFVGYSKECIDCREKGGGIERPDYWQ